MWFVVILVVILSIVLIAAIIVSAIQEHRSSPPPPPQEINTTTCGDDIVIMYNGDHFKLVTCNNHGRMGNSEYILIHKGVRTFVPFRPTNIQGEFNTILITRNSDEIDNVIIHKKDDGYKINTIPHDLHQLYITIY